MVAYFKTSLKQRNSEIAAAKEVKAEVGELQDATIELAKIVSEIENNTAGGDNVG